MEPSIENIIRSKVRAAEDISVAWNKERVWQNIPRKGRKTRRIYTVLGAAASVLLLLTAFFYLTGVSDRNQELADRVLALENQIAGALQLRQVTPPIAVRVIEQACPPGSKSAVAIASPATIYHQRTEAVQTVPVPDEPRGAEIIPEPAVPLATLDTSAAPLHENTISAIVGVIPTPSPVALHAQSRKIKLRIRLNDGEHAAAAAEEAKLFTARLN